MEPEIQISIPPVLVCKTPAPSRAPTLFAIVAYKFLKGLALVVVAVAAYYARNIDLQEELRLVMEQAGLGAGSLLAEAREMLAGITPGTMQLIAAGSVLYGLFSFVEGFGLFLRAGWAGWMAIVESGVFVPVELFDLSRKFTLTMTVILIVNVAIFWYLLANRRRLFQRA